MMILTNAGSVYLKYFIGLIGLILGGALLSILFEPNDTELSEDFVENPDTVVVRPQKPMQPMKPLKRANPVVDTRRVDPSELEKIAKSKFDHIREVQTAHFDEYYDKVTSGWDSRMAELFMNELGLNQEDLTFYFELKNQFENKKMQAFKDYHEQKFQQHGDDYRYELNDDELTFAIDEIKNDYSEQLREKIGEDHYRQYKDALATYNKDLVEMGKGRSGPKIFVEF